MAKLHTFCIVFLSSFFLICLLCPTSIYATTELITHHCSSDHTNTTNNNSSSFQRALKDAFFDLVGSSSSSKSHRATVEGVGVVQTSFHCWRNVPSKACKKCVHSAAKSILRLCPGHQNATVWNLDCTLHYVTSHKDHLNQENNIVPWAWWYSLSSVVEVVTNQDEFESSLRGFMSSLIDSVTMDPRRPVATGEIIVTILDTLYGMVECSTNETPKSCKDCLWAAVDRATECCGGSRAVEVALPSCRLGYDLGPTMSRASLVGPFSSSTSFSDNVIVSKSIADVKKN